MPRGKKNPTNPTENTELVKAELEPVKGEYLQLLQFVSSVDFEERGNLPGVGEVTGLEALGHVREAARLKIKHFTERRLEVTRPIDAAKKGIMDLFRPTIETLEAVLKASTQRLEEHARNVEAARRQALAEMNVSGPTSELVALAQAPQALPPQVKARTVLEFEVEDFELLPNAFKVSNDKAIRAYLEASGGLEAIPGVRTWKTVKVTA
jgi:hypothetical protein